MFKQARRRPRSRATGDTILSTALTLFRRDGIDSTTMRDIAKQADIALGGAYYYYVSKEAILQAYYDRVQEQHHGRVVEAFAGSNLSFEERLKAIFYAKLDILRDDRKILGALFRYAGEPNHPLSALGPSTHENRQEAMATFALAIQEQKLPDDIRAVLPTLLWAAHMGVLLFFIYDDSPEQARTRRLVDGFVSLLTSLLSVVKLPIFKPFRGRLTSLLMDMDLAPAVGTNVSNEEPA